MRLMLTSLLTALVSACSPTSVVEKLLMPEERQLVASAVEDVDRGDGESLSKKVPPQVAKDFQAALPAMREALPPAPRQVTMVNANVTSSGGVRTVSALYQVKGQASWALMEAVMTTRGARTTLTGLHLQRTAVEPMKLNKFSLADAGAGGWAMLVAMLAAVCLTIAALVRIWRSGLFERRWLWTLGALVGITTLRMNWATGAVSFQPLSFQILSVSAVKTPPFAPWSLGVSIPLVALIAFLRRDRRAKAEVSSED